MKPDPFFKARKQEFPGYTAKPKPGEATNYAHRNLCSVEGMDYMLRGRIIDGRRYLGNGCWELVDHEAAETNERREGWK
jgi:hypothetical protein